MWHLQCTCVAPELQVKGTVHWSSYYSTFNRWRDGDMRIIITVWCSGDLIHIGITMRGYKGTASISPSPLAAVELRLNRLTATITHWLPHRNQQAECRADLWTRDTTRWVPARPGRWVLVRRVPWPTSLMLRPQSLARCLVGEVAPSGAGIVARAARDSGLSPASNRAAAYRWPYNTWQVRSHFNYSGTPFERPPWRDANPSGKATWQYKS